MPDDPCKKKVSDASGEYLTEAEADAMLARMRQMAQGRAAKGENYEDALKDIADSVKKDTALAGEIQLRATLLDIRSRRQVRKFVKQFDTLGEGLRAFMEGSPKTRKGARLSVDAQQHAVHGQYLGRVISELESANLLKAFRNDEFANEVYLEMGELGKEDGMPGVSGSKEAMKIASIIESVTSEMVGRQNRAGAYIHQIPGYVVRQTHDMDEIRRAGGPGISSEVRQRSYQAWRDFVIEKLDHEKTFKGQDPEKFMRNVHEALFTGVHGPKLTEFETMSHSLKFDLSRKVSQSRVLHFKDAQAAFEYNQRFGIRSLRDQVLSDIFYRSRSIALMENFGPRVEQNFERLMRELREDARAAMDNGKQVDSLNDWRIQTLFDTVTGKIDVPQNHSLSKAANVARTVAILSKMGATVISALSDKVFMNAEWAAQGIYSLDRWSKQLTGMARSKEQVKMLRLMGVAMDGIIGSTVSRYTAHTTFAGKAHRLQQKLFDLNFLNWWTDTNKGAAAELMSAHLGEHAHLPTSSEGTVRSQLKMEGLSKEEIDIVIADRSKLREVIRDKLGVEPKWGDKQKFDFSKLEKRADEPFGYSHLDAIEMAADQAAERISKVLDSGSEVLPDELGRILSLYNITGSRWDAIRSTAWTMEGSDIKNITPDQLKNIPDATIDKLVEEADLKVTDANRQRIRQELELSLRTFYTDRVNHAVPTPGAAEKKWTTMGTRAGTPLGEAVRMVMMFKAFPITVLTKIMGREVYGRGADTFGQWILNDHRGKFHTAQLIAMTVVAGYMSGAIRDALKGRTPKPLVNDDGSINHKTLMDAASRGGGLGILGDFLFNEYDRQYKTLTGSLAGPVLGQLDPIAEVGTLMKRGEYDRALDRTGKLALDNTPFINLFYLRPVLDYFIFWNLQEMTAPGSLKRVEESVREKNNQGFWMTPSETVR